MLPEPPAPSRTTKKTAMYRLKVNLPRSFGEVTAWFPVLATMHSETPSSRRSCSELRASLRMLIWSAEIWGGCGGYWGRRVKLLVETLLKPQVSTLGKERPSHLKLHNACCHCLSWCWTPVYHKVCLSDPPAMPSYFSQCNSWNLTLMFSG